MLEDSLGHSIKVDSGVRKHEAEAFLVTTLVTGLTEHFDLRPERGRKNRVKYVKSARDYIESHLDAPLGLETLAREVGVSLRTLEAAFREVFDTTPLRYLKLRRLHAARRRLREGRGPELKVTDVALACGFEHLSYFAQDYRALFGEYPSETLGNLSSSNRDGSIDVKCNPSHRQPRKLAAATVKKVALSWVARDVGREGRGLRGTWVARARGIVTKNASTSFPSA